MQNRQRTWTPAVLAQLLLALAVLVAGVVSAVVLPDDDNGDDVLQAASVASTAGTFRSTYALEVDGGGLHITSAGELFVDEARHATAGHVQAPGLGTLELRQVDGRVYVRIPPTRAGAQGKHWAAVPAGGASTVGSQDPFAFLQVLRDGRDVRKVGEEDVNGTPTTHYSVVVDPKKLAQVAAQNPSASALPPGVLDRIKDVKTDVWVDEEKRPRRLRIGLEVQSVTVRTSFEYHDFGKPVDVSAPPADDVLDLSDAQQLGRLLTGG